MAAKKSLCASPREACYARLRAQLAQTGWISEGYVQDRGPGAGGPCYQWTRKVKGKTVSVALSAWQEAARLYHHVLDLLKQARLGLSPGCRNQLDRAALSASSSEWFSVELRRLSSRSTPNSP